MLCCDALGDPGLHVMGHFTAGRMTRSRQGASSHHLPGALLGAGDGCPLAHVPLPSLLVLGVICALAVSCSSLHATPCAQRPQSSPTCIMITLVPSYGHSFSCKYMEESFSPQSSSPQYTGYQKHAGRTHWVFCLTCLSPSVPWAFTSMAMSTPESTLSCADLVWKGKS